MCYYRRCFTHQSTVCPGTFETTHSTAKSIISESSPRLELCKQVSILQHVLDGTSFADSKVEASVSKKIILKPDVDTLPCLPIALPFYGWLR